MYGINEYLVLRQVSDDLKNRERFADHVRWIKEVEQEESAARRRRLRRQWSSFLSLFLF